MRIASVQVFERAVNGIQNATRQVSDTQNQISTGKRVLTPSDDPVAATRILAIDRELALREQYGENIGAARSRLELEEATLDRFQDVLGRLRELAQQATSPALTQTDRQFIGREIEARREELLGLMNSRDASGEFLFAGHQGGQAPFVREPGGGTAYVGDEGQRRLRVSESTTVPVTDSGKRLFVDVPSERTRFAIETHPDNDPVGAAAPAFRRVVDQDALDAAAPAQFVIEFGDPRVLDPAQANVTVRDRDTGRVIDGVEDQPFASGSPVRFAGVEIVITGQPQPGDRFLVRTTGTEPVLDAVDRLGETLRVAGDTAAGQALLAEELGAAIAAFDAQDTRILEVRSELGARLNTLDSVAALHEQLDVQARETLSELRDLDYAEAVSRLNFQSFVLEAAQRSFARTSNLSLFDLI